MNYKKMPTRNPIPSLKDNRADFLALSAIEEISKLECNFDPTRTACIALVPHGCKDHLGKVLEAAQQKKVKPGNFTRMGPHTIATYLATAMGFHGPTIALLTDNISDGYEIAANLVLTDAVDGVCLIIARPNGCTVCLIPS